MDLYWEKLLDTYNSLNEGMLARDRWKLAYHMVTNFDPEGESAPSQEDAALAQTPQDFVGQYALAVAHMVATHSSGLHLPANFMARWRAATLAERG